MHFKQGHPKHCPQTNQPGSQNDPKPSSANQCLALRRLALHPSFSRTPSSHKQALQIGLHNFGFPAFPCNPYSISRGNHEIAVSARPRRGSPMAPRAAPHRLCWHPSEATSVTPGSHAMCVFQQSCLCRLTIGVSKGDQHAGLCIHINLLSPNCYGSLGLAVLDVV